MPTHLVAVGPRGRLGRGGPPVGTTETLRRVFADLADSDAGDLTIYFHAGLRDLTAEVALSEDMLAPIAENCETYPVFFAWGTGALDALRARLTTAVEDPRFFPAVRALLATAARRLVPRADDPAGPLTEVRRGLAALRAGELPGDGSASLDLLCAHCGLDTSPVTDAEVAGLPVPEAGAALRAAVGRYAAGREHGLLPTLLEEWYRATLGPSMGLTAWHDVEENARRAYDPLPPGSGEGAVAGGSLFLRLLGAHIAAHGPVRLNLVGHSAGCIHLCHFVSRGAGRLGEAFGVANVVLVAPACRFDLFARTLVRHGDRIARARILVLPDEQERLASVIPWLPLGYPASLLYLTSGLFAPGGPDAPLLGLARHLERARAAAAGRGRAAAVGKWLQRRQENEAGIDPVVYAGPREDGAPAFTAHLGTGGPEHDLGTLDAIAAVLRPPPRRDVQELAARPPGRTAALEAAPAVVFAAARSADRPPARAASSNAFAGLEESAPDEAGTLEAIIGENEIVGHALVKALMTAGRAVARIVVPGVEDLASVRPAERADAWSRARRERRLVDGYGTGWILGCGCRALITNNHVLPLAEAARNAVVEFGFEGDIRRPPQPRHVLRLRPEELFVTSPNFEFGGLDYTVVALSRVPPRTYGFLEPRQGITAVTARNIHIVQHPSGEGKAYVLSNNKKVNLSGHYVAYLSDTLKGSSGSPLFDDRVRLVGIHHLGEYRTKLGDREEVSNLGSRIEVVIDDMLGQLRDRGWDTKRVVHYFGDGMIAGVWRRMPEAG